MEEKNKSFIDSFLRAYEDTSQLVRYRVRVFLILNFVALLVDIAIFINNIGTGTEVPLATGIGAVIMTGLFVLIYRGNSDLAGVLFLFLIGGVVWSTMFYHEEGIPIVANVNTLSFIYALLAISPVITGRRGMLLFFIFTLAVFFLFMFKAPHIVSLNDLAWRDMMQDGLLAMLFIGIMSYLLLDLTLRAQKVLEDNNEQLRYANEDLAATNEELTATMEELEASMEELEAGQQQLIESQQEMEETQHELRTILNTLPLPVILFRKGEFVYRNKRHDELFGTAVPFKTLSEYIKWLPRADFAIEGFSDYITRLIDSGDREKPVVGDPVALNLLDGESRTVEPIITFSDNRVCIIFNDLSEQVRARELMVQTEKLTTISGMAAGVAHEINNPLGIIIQGVDTVLLRLKADMEKNLTLAEELGLDMKVMNQYLTKRKVLSYLESVRDAGERASKIVTGMLDFSRTSAGVEKYHDIHEIIDSAIMLASRDYDLKKQYDFRRIQLVRSYGEDIPTVTCNRSEIEQVLLNLLKNAAQAMSLQPGKKEGIIELKTVATASHIEITVRDNGPGMNEEKLNRIFEPFFTTKERGMGTGLGLSVSNYIIHEKHNGSITVASRPDEGTAFTILLPLGGKRER